MEEMFDKIVQQINSMNGLAKKLIKYGFVSFVLLMISCLSFSILNRYSWGNNYQISKNTIDLFKASFSVLAITVIGGLITDYITKNG